jgi:hypothetical protein
MRSKRLVLLSLVFIFLLVSISLSSALTAKLGNSRMILRTEAGAVVERSLNVINDNDVSVDIELEPLGDLADEIDLTEETFTLSPGEEKKVYFTIMAREEGTTETKINVKFIPEQGNIVALAANVIVIAKGESDNPVQTTQNQNPESNTGEPENNNRSNSNSNGFNFNPQPGNLPDEEETELSPVMILLISTIILAIVLIVLMFYAFKKPKKTKKTVKKGSRRTRG